MQVVSVDPDPYGLSITTVTLGVYQYKRIW